MADAALAGLRVVEWGDFIAPSYCGKLLADLGAEVVKVELPGRGDRARRQGPFPNDDPHPEKSGLFLYLNSNKLGVTLDPATPSGRTLFLDLVRWADVLVENHLPSWLEEQQLDYAALEPVNPRLVMASITPFGYDTPYRDFRGYALNATAGSGIAWRIGDPDRAPVWLPLCAADYQGGVHAACAAMAAVAARRLTGEGQHTWVAEVELMGSVLGGSQLARYLYQGHEVTRAGNRMRQFYPWQVMPCADGYFEIITMVDSQWASFIDLMGNPDWKDDERLANRWLAWQWADDIDAYWAPWLKERTKAELWQAFRERHISFQPVHTTAEVVESDQLRERGYFVEIGHPDAGTFRYPGAPYRFSETPWAIRRPAPRLGEHNALVFGEWLGRSAGDLVALARAGVI